MKINFVFRQQFKPGADGKCTNCDKTGGDHYPHPNGNMYCVSICLHLCLRSLQVYSDKRSRFHLLSPAVPWGIKRRPWAGPWTRNRRNERRELWVKPKSPCYQLDLTSLKTWSQLCVCVCERERERESVCVCVANFIELFKVPSMCDGNKQGCAHHASYYARKAEGSRSTANSISNERDFDVFEADGWPKYSLSQRESKKERQTDRQTDTHTHTHTHVRHSDYLSDDEQSVTTESASLRFIPKICFVHFDFAFWYFFLKNHARLLPGILTRSFEWRAKCTSVSLLEETLAQETLRRSHKETLRHLTLWQYRTHAKATQPLSTGHGGPLVYVSLCASVSSSCNQLALVRRSSKVARYGIANEALGKSSRIEGQTDTWNVQKRHDMGRYVPQFPCILRQRVQRGGLICRRTCDTDAQYHDSTTLE